MKKTLLSLLIITLLGASNLPAENILLVTDIHFNPYAQVAQGAPTTQLHQIVRNRNVQHWKFGHIAPAGYHVETNSASLDSGLAEIQRVAAAQKVRHVFICGDMLEHGFEADFAKYVGEPDRLADFSSDVILYLLARIKTATQGAEIYYALGNNDSNLGDYSTPSRKFLNNLADGFFGPNPSPAKKTFAELGYSNRALSPTVRVISLNGNLLTHRNHSTPLARQQLTLLRRDLATCRREGQRAIILMHEPFGIDAYSSYRSAARQGKTQVQANRSAAPLERMGLSSPPPPQAITFLHQGLQEEYLRVIEAYASSIATIYAGHTHMEYLESIGHQIPLIGTIALNSFYGNNPGFKILTIDDKTGDLIDYQTYVSELNKPHAPWRKLYQFSTAYASEPARRERARFFQIGKIPVFPRYVPLLDRLISPKRSLVEVINRFPYDPANPAVQRYRTYYSGLSPHADAIQRPEVWPYYHAAMTHPHPASFRRAVQEKTKAK